jgi:hypothetical protein
VTGSLSKNRSLPRTSSPNISGNPHRFRVRGLLVHVSRMYSASQSITRCSKNRARDAHIAKSVRPSVLKGPDTIWLEDVFASGPHRSCVRGSQGPSLLQSIGAYSRIGIAHLFVAITGRSVGGRLALTERTSHVECFSEPGLGVGGQVTIVHACTAKGKHSPTRRARSVVYGTSTYWQIRCLVSRCDARERGKEEHSYDSGAVNSRFDSR